VTLAPEIQSLIDWGATTFQAHASLELPELRTAIRDELDRELQRQGVVVEPVATTFDEQIEVSGGEIRARVFVPDLRGHQPAFVHFHGGGFVFGTIDSLVNDAKCAHICREVGCVVITVEYRLAPAHRFPVAAEDCYAALRWTVGGAERLGIDPTRVAVGGESAGGNLAATVALMARDRGGPALALQVLEVPVTDISPAAAHHASVSLFCEGYGLDWVEMESYAKQYLDDPADGGSPYASPLLADDLTGVAPAHVMTAEYDVLRDSGEAYAHRLEAAGVETLLRRNLGHTHGSAVLWQTWGPARAWMDEVVAGLRHGFSEREVELL
jgi:acetyl esterase